MSLSFDLVDENATLAFGARLGRVLRVGDVIALHGDLGAGKTTLTRGLVQEVFGKGEEVTSPTYTLVQVYEGEPFTLWHFDLYRLEVPEGVLELGWEDTLSGVAIIEWPERAGRFLPSGRLDVILENEGDGRRARLEAVGEDWQERLHDFTI